jgi:hypothetical protein
MWSYCIWTFDKSALRPTVHLYIPYGFYSKRLLFPYTVFVFDRCNEQAEFFCEVGVEVLEIN